jgi:hypothetical protein
MASRAYMKTVPRIGSTGRRAIGPDVSSVIVVTEALEWGEGSGVRAFERFQSTGSVRVREFRVGELRGEEESGGGINDP